MSLSLTHRQIVKEARELNIASGARETIIHLPRMSPHDDIEETSLLPRCQRHEVSIHHLGVVRSRGR